jgi:hypothetical protein
MPIFKGFDLQLNYANDQPSEIEDRERGPDRVVHEQKDSRKWTDVDHPIGGTALAFGACMKKK